MELFAQIVNRFKSLATFAKKAPPYILSGSKYASVDETLILHKDFRNGSSKDLSDKDQYDLNIHFFFKIFTSSRAHFKNIEVLTINLTSNIFCLHV